MREGNVSGTIARVPFTLLIGALALGACSTPNYQPFPAPSEGGTSADGSAPTGDGGPITELDGGTPIIPGTIETFVAGIADPDNPGVTLNLGEIAVDATHVYVVAFAYVGGGIKGYLTKTPRSGAATSTTVYSSSGQLGGLAIDAQLAYVAGAGKIVQVPLAGGGAVDFVTPGNSPIAASGDAIFWMSDNTIFSKPKGGGAAALVQQDPRAESAALPHYFVADADTFYWRNIDGVVRAPLSGAGPITTLVPGGNSAGGRSLALDKDLLYYSPNATCDIHAMLKSGGTNAKRVSISCADLNRPLFIAVDDAYVWWTTSSKRVARSKKL